MNFIKLHGIRVGNSQIRATDGRFADGETSWKSARETRSSIIILALPAEFGKDLWKYWHELRKKNARSAGKFRVEFYELSPCQLIKINVLKIIQNRLSSFSGPSFDRLFTRVILLEFQRVLLKTMVKIREEKLDGEAAWYTL